MNIAKNANVFVTEGVDLIIEFQIEEQMRRRLPIISRQRASSVYRDPIFLIPTQPDFGVDNYQVGSEAGEISRPARTSSGKIEGRQGWSASTLPRRVPFEQSRINGDIRGRAICSCPTSRRSYIQLSTVRGNRARRAHASLATSSRAYPCTDRILVAGCEREYCDTGSLQNSRGRAKRENVAIVGQDRIPES